MIPWGALTILLILLSVDEVDFKDKPGVFTNPFKDGSYEYYLTLLQVSKTSADVYQLWLEVCEKVSSVDVYQLWLQACGQVTDLPVLAWIVVIPVGYFFGWMLLKALGSEDKEKEKLLSELKHYRKTFMRMEKEQHNHIRARINARNDLARSNTTLQRMEKTNKQVREEKEAILKEIGTLRQQAEDSVKDVLKEKNHELVEKENELASKSAELLANIDLLAKAEQENKQLEGKLTTSRAKENELHTENEALKTKIKELEEILAASKIKEKELNDANASLLSERKELEDDLEDSRDKESLLRMENASLKLERDKLEEYIYVCGEKEKKLKMENAAAKLETKNLEKDLEASKDKEMELSIENNTLKLKKKELEEDLNASKEKENVLRNEITALKIENKERQENLQSSKEKQNALQDENSALMSQLSEMSRKLCEEIEMLSSLREELASLNLKHSALGAELIAKEKEILKAKLRICLNCKKQRKQYDELMAEFQNQDYFFRCQLQRLRLQAEVDWHRANDYKHQSEFLRQRLFTSLKTDSKPP